MTDPLMAIPEYLRGRPTKEEFDSFLEELARRHPKELSRLVGFRLLWELAQRYPPDVLESMARGTEHAVQLLEPFGDYPEDFFTPLLNAGWIRGETLIDAEKPPDVAELVGLKGMLDRHQARERANAAAAVEPGEEPVLRMVRQLSQAGQLPRGQNGEVNISATARMVSDALAALPGGKGRRKNKGAGGHLRQLVAAALKKLS